MAEEIDFCELSSTNHYIPVVAGAFAGILEHTVMYPIDSVKTRIQLIKSLTPNKSIREVFNHMIKNEGYLSVYRGMGAVIIGTGPAHSLHFGSYELMKHLLPKYLNLSQDSSVVHALSGATATVFHDLLMNPVEVIKQRLQMDNLKYNGIIHCARCVQKSEGIGAFYRSFPIQLFMNIPYHCCNFVFYEFCKIFLSEELNSSYAHTEITDEIPFNPVVYLLSGVISGGLAAAITTPFDVVKTHINTQRVSVDSNTLKSCHCHPFISFGNSTKQNKFVPLGNIGTAVKYIYECGGGVRAFFRGTAARVIYTAPSCAISWSVYEFFKMALAS